MATFGENKEEEHDPQFAPVHQLTDKDQIETKTFEEDENVEFKMRAKLFRFESTSNEWKERGTGDVRILAHKQTKKVRLVMRRDKTLKVCANHYITSDMRLQPNIGSDRSWVWKVAADVSEGTPTAETLAIRFANSDNAGQFKTAFEAAQRTNAEIATGNTSAVSALAVTEETPAETAPTTSEEPESAEPAASEEPSQDSETPATTTEEPSATEPTAEGEAKADEETDSPEKEVGETIAEAPAVDKKDE